MNDEKDFDGKAPAQQGTVEAGAEAPAAASPAAPAEQQPHAPAEEAPPQKGGAAAPEKEDVKASAPAEKAGAEQDTVTFTKAPAAKPAKGTKAAPAKKTPAKAAKTAPAQKAPAKAANTAGQKEKAAAPEEKDAPAPAEEKPAEEKAGQSGEKAGPAAQKAQAGKPDAAPAQKEGTAASAKRTHRRKKTGKSGTAKAGQKAAAPKAEGKPAPEKDAAPQSGGAPFAKPGSNKQEIALTPEQIEAANLRAAEMTRTVQVSLEEILQGMDAQPQPELPEPEEAVEETAAPRPLGARIGLGVLHGVWGIFKWLLLVLLFVAIIAGAGVYWLWQGATSDMLPQLQASINGQALQPTAYEWHVPVVNDYFTRTYAETLADGAPALGTPVNGTHPQFTVAPNGYTAQLTFWNEAGKELFNGTLQEYTSFNFAENGSYKARLVLGKAAENVGGSAEVTGTQTYDFTFQLSIKPLVQLAQSSAHQGEIVALTVTGTAEGDVPRLETDLGHGGFIPTGNGWVCYVAIAHDQEPIGYALRVHTRDHVQDVQLTVRSTEWEVRDYDDRSRLTNQYLGEGDTPAAVQDVLEIYDDQPYWAADGFAQPYPSGAVVRLAYGTTEYVGRTQAQKDAGGGSGRTACNEVLTCASGSKVLSPAKGRVLLAEDLGEGIGHTVVVEHGGGLKTILYGLLDLTVAKGDMVTAGQRLGTADAALVAEVRVGSTPVEPQAVWSNQCEALRVH